MNTNNNSVPDYAARIAAASTQSLVEEFNRQVGSNAAKGSFNNASLSS